VGITEAGGVALQAVDAASEVETDQEGDQGSHGDDQASEERSIQTQIISERHIHPHIPHNVDDDGNI